jgi:STAS domain
MLRIQRFARIGGVTLAASGRITASDLRELRAILGAEAPLPIVLDLGGVSLVDVEAVAFLSRAEAAGLQLQNCPPYIREWIAREGDHEGDAT